MPTDVPVVTDVAIQEADAGLALADEKLDSLAQSLGLVGIPQAIMSKLRNLGIAAESLGVTAIARGGALHTEIAVTDLISKLQNEANDAAEKKDVRKLQEITRTLGYIADKRTKNHKFLVESVDPIKDEQKQAVSQRNASWTPGTVVGPSVNIQVQPGGSVTVQEGAKTPSEEKNAP